jgi:four helix bundle protein
MVGIGIARCSCMDTKPVDFAPRAFHFACQIVELYKTLSKSSAMPPHLSRQLLRSGTSIGANLEEAVAAQSRRDLKCKFQIALKEARETKYWLRLFIATRLVSSTAVSSILREADELVAILTVSVQRLKAKKG